MAIFDLFSKRQKRLREEVPEVYAYNEVPNALRVQIIHIWRDVLGDEGDYQNGHGETSKAYQFLVETLCREYGVFRLPGENGYGGRNYLEELANYLLQEDDHERALDVIELSFVAVDTATRRWEYLHRSNAEQLADDAIRELNRRFREHGVGYQFECDKLIRVDSQLVHAEVVKPALALLSEPEYAGAQAEFLKAHHHYRRGDGKEALVECLKAFESVIKSICAKRSWPVNPNATISALLRVVFDNALIPAFWTSHFSALRSTLESGVPTARNRLGGHGQGSSVVVVPEHLVAYVLHQTASAIVFLAEAEKALP